jgi:metal transporter CNNM
MAPAPKARVQKSQFVGNPDSVVIPTPEDHLIDLSDDHPETRNQPTNGYSRTRSESPTIAAFGTSPKTTFIRRSSGGADGNLISVRGNVNDMREHLKHLGPSNLASRPKTTRYNTVKIKPGHGSVRTDSRTDSNLNRDSIAEEPYEDTPTSPAPRGGEGEGLLKSAGKEASDGVHALQQGYGTLERSFSQSPNKPAASTAAKEVPSKSSPTPPRLNIKRADSNNSSDTLRSLQSKDNNSTRRKRGTARSGSITENIVEAGGVRKVVLETNSSSSDDRDDRAPSRGKGSENTPPNSSNAGLPDRPPVYGEHTERPATPKGEEVKKKRRRTRKKKGTSTKSSEESALLGGNSHQ